MPPSKRPRRDGVLRYLRQQVAAMIPPPPAPEPEVLWSMPTNLLQVCQGLLHCEDCCAVLDTHVQRGGLLPV